MLFHITLTWVEYGTVLGQIWNRQINNANILAYSDTQGKKLGQSLPLNYLGLIL